MYILLMQTERVLFHYNGHGVPKPTANGEIWVFNKVRGGREVRFYLVLFLVARSVESWTEAQERGFSWLVLIKLCARMWTVSDYTTV